MTLEKILFMGLIGDNTEVFIRDTDYGICSP